MSKASAWQDRLDQVDPFFGEQDELLKLRKTAPTKALEKWLDQCIQENSRFKDLFVTPQIEFFEDSTEGQRIIAIRERDQALFKIKRLREKLFAVAILAFVVGCFFGQLVHN
jgi:hypothetical protein